MQAEQPTSTDPLTGGQPKPHLVVADAVRVLGGAERFALDAVRGLRSRGWPVTLLAYPGSPLARRATDEGLPLHTARTRANGAPWTVLPLAAWMRRQRVGILLSLYDKDLRTAALAARLADRRCAVVHSRECDGPIKDRPWIRAFYCRLADRILVNSEATRRTTLASAPWLDPGRVQVLPKGVDVASLAAAVPTGDGADAEGALVFGFAGQLVGRKRVDVLLRSLASLGPTAPPWRLRLAGTGPEEPALRALAATLGLEEHVVFEGFVPEMGPWYARIDALVLPSLVEGWGYVLAEAAACGRAVLAFRASSVPEVVDEKSGALLADPPGPAQLASVLEKALAEGREGLRRRGRMLQAHARAQLGLDRMLSDLETRLLECSRRRRGPA